MKPKYCFHCGYPLKRKKINHRYNLFCKKCGWIKYGNPLPVAAAVVINAGKLLLIQRGIAPFKGVWALPTGFMDQYEDPQAACLRELKEETGVTGKISQLINVYQKNNSVYGSVLVVAYLVKVKNPRPVPGDDALEARFFPLNQLPPLPVPTHRELIAQAITLSKKAPRQ